MHPVSCTNTHHDVTDLVNHGMAKNTKTWISWERNITFLRNKKILNLCLRWHILRSYRFAAEVNFKAFIKPFEVQERSGNKNNFFSSSGTGREVLILYVLRVLLIMYRYLVTCTYLLLLTIFFTYCYVLLPLQSSQ